MKQIILITIALLYSIPVLAQINYSGYRYYCVYNGGQFEATDEVMPYLGIPTEVENLYFKGNFGAYYTNYVIYPWVCLDAYGWCYVAFKDSDTIYITGDNLRINAPLDIKIQGWYRMQDIYLCVVQEEPYVRAYWAQDLYSYDRDETIQVNLGWVKHYEIRYQLQPVAGGDATR